jgi:hypothetical protein
VFVLPFPVGSVVATVEVAYEVRHSLSQCCRVQHIQ